MLGGLVALLAPPVLSEAMARLLGREREWLRYATAFNWSRWAMLLALGAGLMLMGMLAGAGLVGAGGGGGRAAGGGRLQPCARLVRRRVGLRLDWWQAAVLVAW